MNAPPTATQQVGTTFPLASDAEPTHARRGFQRLVRRQPLGVVAGGIILVLVAGAVFAPFVAPYDPYQVSPAESLTAPSWKHPFGTDTLGRDVFSRVVY